MENMKAATSIRHLALITGCVAIFAASPEIRAGTDILHLDLRKRFAGEGGSSNVVGEAITKYHQQGGAEQQRLELKLSGLETNSTLHLFAWLRNETNATFITSLVADDDGKLRADYSSNNSGRSPGRGRGHHALPEGLSPLHQIVALTITDTSTQTVASVDFSLPDKMQFLVKRELTNVELENTATGTLRLHATTRGNRLQASTRSLTPGESYSLVLGDFVAGSEVADSKGRTDFRTSFEAPLDALGLGSVRIWNATSNVVLSTTLP